MIDDDAFLARLLACTGAVAGTVHRVSEGALRLSAAQNIPPPVIEATRVIPEGKGMAGLAWARRAPVQTCDLQDDRSGDVRPGARAVAARGAVALPVFDEVGGVRAVVGLAFAEEGELQGEALARLQDLSSRLSPAGPLPPRA